MRSNEPSVEALPNVNEVVPNRERFFFDGVSPTTHPVICGDKRGAIGIDEYVHLFGGGLNPVYNSMVLQEVAQPGTVTESFGKHAEVLMPMLKRVGLKVAVHSDRRTEQGEQLRLWEDDGSVGCAYARERLQISRLIGDEAEDVIDTAASLRPELFQYPAARSFASAVAAAHGRLADRQGVASDGRKAVLAAAHSGAETAIVDGDSDAKAVGIINLEESTSIHSGEALAAGLPAYVQDSWATAEIFDATHGLYVQPKDQVMIAELIDTVGTMWALGVDEIAVRRPKGLPQAA